MVRAAHRLRTAAECRHSQATAAATRFARVPKARHPGASNAAPVSKQLEAILQRTLPDVDITKPIAVDQIPMFEKQPVG